MTAVDERPAPAVEQRPRRTRGARRARPAPVPRPPRAARPVRPPAPPRSTDDALRVVSTAFTVISVVALWLVAQLLVLGDVSQERAQGVLYDRFRTELASATAPVGPLVEVGAPVALVEAPSIGLAQVVVEGTASGDLLVGPGHRRDTVLPGQAGVSVVYGRAATYGAPFAALPLLAPGDEVRTTSAQGEQVFEVVGVRRAGDPLPAPPAAGTARLTLVTAEGEGRLGALGPGSVVYVDAEAPEGFAAPAGRAPAVPGPESAMANDPGALPLLALCTAFLVVLVAGVVVALQRWRGVLVWVVAAPVVAATAWTTTDVVMRLLPNLV